MRIYRGSMILRRFEAQKITFVIDPYLKIFFCKCRIGGGGEVLKCIENSERDRKAQSSVHCFNKPKVYF